MTFVWYIFGQVFKSIGFVIGFISYAIADGFTTGIETIKSLSELFDD